MSVGSYSVQQDTAHKKLQNTEANWKGKIQNKSMQQANKVCGPLLEKLKLKFLVFWRDPYPKQINELSSFCGCFTYSSFLNFVHVPLFSMAFWKLSQHHFIFDLYWIWALNTTVVDISAPGNRPCLMRQASYIQMGVQVLYICSLQLLMMKLCRSQQQLVVKQLSSLCWSWSFSDFTITWSISFNEQKNLHFLPVGLFCPVLTPLPAHHRVKTSISDAPRETAGVHPRGKGRGAAWYFLAVVIF